MSPVRPNIAPRDWPVAVRCRRYTVPRCWLWTSRHRSRLIAFCLFFCVFPLLMLKLLLDYQCCCSIMLLRLFFLFLLSPFLFLRWKFFFCCRRNFQLPIQFPVSFRSIRPLQHFHHTQLGLRHTLNHDVCARKYREQLRANRFEAKIHLAAQAAKKFAKIVCSNSFRTVHEQWRNKLYCVYRA